MAPTPAMTADEAEALGYEIDRCVYPWIAYRGPRFATDDFLRVVTPAWPPADHPAQRAARQGDDAFAAGIADCRRVLANARCPRKGQPG